MGEIEKAPAKKVNKRMALKKFCNLVNIKAKGKTVALPMDAEGLRNFNLLSGMRLKQLLEKVIDHQIKVGFQTIKMQELKDLSAAQKYVDDICYKAMGDYDGGDKIPKMSQRNQNLLAELLPDIVQAAAVAGQKMSEDSFLDQMEKAEIIEEKIEEEADGEEDKEITDG